MFPEARLEIVLRVRAGRVADVSVRSTRLVQASRLFAGRRPDEVTALLPTVFSLCGTAQVLAGLAAMEQASGLPPSAAQTPARSLLLLAEIVAEHGMGMARDWPSLVGSDPDLAAARRIPADRFACDCGWVGPRDAGRGGACPDCQRQIHEAA